jgi:hypothetical protein
MAHSGPRVGTSKKIWSASPYFAFEIKSPFVSSPMIDFVNNFYPIVARAQRSRRANAHPDVGM